MSKIIPPVTLIAMAAVLLSISFSTPWLLDDRNIFLKKFVGEGLLSTLGFILTVTLASSASLHLELNKIQDATGKTFDRTRKSIRRSAYSLMTIFGAAAILVVVKPLLPEVPYNIATANSLAILFIYFNLSVLYDLTRTVFKIPAISHIKFQDAAAPSMAIPSDGNKERADSEAMMPH